MLLITKDYATLVDALPPDAYLEKEIFELLLQNPGLRERFLDQWGSSKVVVATLGDAVVPEKEYYKRLASKSLPAMPFRKEVGYHHRLSRSVTV